jgi:hypothetical protein
MKEDFECLAGEKIDLQIRDNKTYIKGEFVAWSRALLDASSGSYHQLLRMGLLFCQQHARNPCCSIIIPAIEAIRPHLDPRGPASSQWDPAEEGKILPRSLQRVHSPLHPPMSFLSVYIRIWHGCATNPKQCFIELNDLGLEGLRPGHLSERRRFHEEIWPLATLLGASQSAGYKCQMRKVGEGGEFE